MTGTLHEDHNTFLVIPRSVLVRMRNVSDKNCTESKHTFYVQHTVFENCTVYEIMWKNTIKPDMPQMTIQRMRFACWIPQATNSHSEYVIHSLYTATTGTLPRLNVTSHVHCLSCSAIRNEFQPLYV